MENRIYEENLQLPALYLIKLKNGNITTSELSKLLRSILKPSGEDLVILDKRKDDRFSQIVRNLTASKRPFVKNGFIKRDNKKNSPLFITKKGEHYLSENQFFLEYLLVNDFQWNDLKDSLKTIHKSTEEKRKIEVFDETIMIQEGVKKLVKNKVYERSSKLRRVAIEHYTKNDDILCDACKFSFNNFYGKKTGKGYIEIHHIKPIFKYQDEELDKTIDVALKNVVPLCSNCHRMIHRDWRNPLQVNYLIEQINQNGIFNRLN